MATADQNGFEVRFNGKVIATFPVEPHASVSGKTTVLGTSHGNMPTTGQYDGKPIIVGFNAYVRA